MEKVRVQPTRKQITKVVVEEKKTTNVAELIPEVASIVGFEDLDITKLKELLVRSQYDERKFFIKLRRNLYYYKHNLKINAPETKSVQEEIQSIENTL